jgi:hypothetical protein
MTKTVNQIIIFFIHQNQNMLFQQHWESEYFFRKKHNTPHPFKLNGPSLRQQLFFSLLDIPQTISLNLVMFGSVKKHILILVDEKNNNLIHSFGHIT